jgi:hypothetical protein
VTDYVAFIVSGSTDANIRNTVSFVGLGFKLNPGEINFAEKLKSARSNFCIIFQINTLAQRGLVTLCDKAKRVRGS